MTDPIPYGFTKAQVDSYRAILSLSPDMEIEEKVAIVTSHDADVFFRKMRKLPEEKRLKFWDWFNGKEQTYMYMVTFTIDPKKPHDVDNIEAYIHKQPLRSEFRTKSAYIVREYTKAGQAHWHMSIVTGKSLRNDAFKYYREKYGSVDKRTSVYNNQADALLYMGKQGEPIKIV